MKYRVMMSDDATADLFDIYRHVAATASPRRATRVLEQIERAAHELEENPGRGHVPQELLAFGVTEFLEVDIKPYRLIYRVGKRRVYIHCVLDGRRDLERLLQERILR
jgi:toxin ParE1/3/4